MRGLKRDRTARIIVAGHAFVQNLRRGFYDLGTDVPAGRRVRRTCHGDLTASEAPTLPHAPAPANATVPPEVITLAVRWYLRFGLSYRDVEELLAERGVKVDHVTIYRCVQRFAPEFAEAARARQHLVGDRWHVDETYLKIGGTWRYLFRAIDQFGQVIDRSE